MAKHEEVKIRPFWYTDTWVFPKLITILTTLDEKGRLNAAPYSHIMQYDVMKKNPRMIIGFRQDSHTYVNIKATGEFVINCPTFDQLDDMMETARFWPEGVNELEHTNFTTIPSKTVKPPTIAECPQIAECTVDQVIDLDKSSGIIIANITAMFFHEGLKDMSRPERLKAMNLPIGLGDEARKDYYHTNCEPLVMHELHEPPQGLQGGKIELSLPWENDAMETLMKIPVGVRTMVAKNLEEYVKEKEAETVTMDLFNAMTEDMGMDADMFARFEGN
jgi:flavin reductase (DIM6/NTAB) family NADH-FMN oxidoreductase RutF